MSNKKEFKGTSEKENVNSTEILCMVCYEFADAMLKVRKQ